MHMDKEKIIQAGKISAEVKKYARSIIKKDMPLIEIANKIDAKIEELGAKPAFPVNLSINEIAAHYTPSHDDLTLAHGILKVDVGIHVNGWIADTAFSLDLDDDEENKKLIKSAEEALANALQIAVKGVSLSEIGKTIQKTIESYGFSPIINLSGHSIERYEIHAGETIPNIEDKRDFPLKEGQYAIEPFATFGNGKVYDGPDSGIYQLISEKNVRSPITREILKFIIKDYKTLPFCSRWLVKKFGTKTLFGLKQLQENGNLHHFSQLIESSRKKVAQAEHTIIVEKDQTIITTLEN